MRKRASASFHHGAGRSFFAFKKNAVKIDIAAQTLLNLDLPKALTSHQDTWAMPFQKTNLDGGLGCCFEAFGTITAGEYVSAMLEHLTCRDGSFEKLRYTIVRMDQAEPWHIEHVHMHYVGRLALEAYRRNPLPVVAVITPPDVSPREFRLFPGTPGRTTWEYAAFRDSDDAQLWLHRLLAEKFGLTGLSLSKYAPFSLPLGEMALLNAS